MDNGLMTEGVRNTDQSSTYEDIHKLNSFTRHRVLDSFFTTVRVRRDWSGAANEQLMKDVIVGPSVRLKKMK